MDVAAIAPADLPGAVLDECHGPLRGRMDRIAATVQFADESTVKVFARLPDQLRTAGPNGVLLLVDGRAYRLGEETGQPVDARTEQWLRDLLTVADAAALGPLQRASACRSDGDGWLLTEPRGPMRLQLRQDTLLPQRLAPATGDAARDAASAVTFVDFLRTTKTWMAQHVQHPALGACALTFDLADLQWAPDLFTPPAEKAPVETAPKLVMPTSGGMESRSPTPIPGSAAALRLVVVDDPGDWAQRAAVYAPIQLELERQDQKIAGFPMLFTDGDRQLLGAPFRQRPGGPALAPPADWEIRSEPDTELLVVYPPQGDFEQRRKAGAELLQAALAAAGRKARGPIVAQPFLHLQDGVPPADKLAAPVVRMTVALLPGK